MSLPPLGGRPPLPPRPGTAGSTKSALTSTEERASQAERDATRRIAGAEQTVEEARRAADHRIEEIQDQYEKREVDVSARNEEQLEKQRLKGYETLKDLQRTQQNELAQVRRQGERDLRKLQDHYRDSIFATQRNGSEELQKLESNQVRNLEYQRRTYEADKATAEEQYHKQSEDMKSTHESRLVQEREAQKQEFERTRAQTIEASEKGEERFQSKLAEQVAKQDEELAGIHNRASEAIREIRRDTAQKLAAYASRQNDPFYQMLDLNAQLTDQGDHYELTATIPEHEQKHVTVSLKGSQLVLSGSRRNEEKAEIAPGRTQGTNSFQTYLETFPIAWPVDTRQMTREFDGDQLIVRLPKKSEDHTYKSPVLGKEKPARARVERPKFPENLPIAKFEAERNSPADPSVTIQTSSKKGGKTLT